MTKNINDDATARPWPKAEYQNDTGPDDEGFWECWRIEEVGEFFSEADSELARIAVNERDALLAVESAAKDCTSGHRDHKAPCNCCECALWDALASLKQLREGK